MNKEKVNKTRVLKFPIEVFPLELQEVIVALHESSGIPLDFYACSMLSVFSSAMGNTYHIIDWNNYQQIGSLFMCIVGNSSIGKSPAFKSCLKPLYRLEATFKEDFKANMSEDKTREEILITDATIESISDILSNNPKGLLLYKDELVGWLNSMTRYSNSSDVNYYLETWQGNYTKTSRIGRASTFVSSPFLGIVGGTQPNLLYRFAKGDNLHNGFLQRILFCYPNNQKKANRSKKRIDSLLVDKYDNWVNRVYNIPFDKESEDPTILLKLSADADDRWGEWFNENTAEINSFDDKNNPIISCLGKLEQYCLRFSLILEVIHQSNDVFPEIKEVSLDSMEKAILLTEYFKSMLYKVFEKLENPLESYSKKDLAFLNALEDDFDVTKGLETADKVGITKSNKAETIRRTFFRKMKQFIKDGLIEKVGQANYTKLI
jgi:hypothetical protein